MLTQEKIHFRISIEEKTRLADTVTPVNIYLRLRDVFANSILLESSDYHGNENSLSFICCDPIASFTLANDSAELVYPDQTKVSRSVHGQNPLTLLEDFKKSFIATGNQKYPVSGLFGFMSYDIVRYLENIDVKVSPRNLPDMIYNLYRYVIVVDHFSNEMTLCENRVDGASAPKYSIEAVEQMIFSNRTATYTFRTTGEEMSNVTDQEFRNMVDQGKAHCNRGDVFQIVLSRRFSLPFAGDEFNVYRTLRSLNPSPYLFFFDYGDFKLFGSSPEAQLRVSDGKAYIHPIAGTFKRTGNDVEDAELAARLARDEKENAEHLMLVDLARNDLSRSTDGVAVDVFKEIQFYSHVIHLVSRVSGTLDNKTSALQIAADTFPAGTLSGAPKHKAMTLIGRYENINRGFYGGALGFVGFDGSFNHAIMIRTFMSRGNELTYQAGAGVVAKSDSESELQEVNNKLAALRRAVRMAETIAS